MTAPARSVAQDHYATTQSFVNAAAKVAGDMWSEVDPGNIVGSWVQQLPELTTVVAGAQLGVSRQADEYVGEALESQGLSDESVAPIQPSAFAGTASDGRGLMTLLANPLIVTLLTISDIHDVGRAMGAGRANLDMLVRTQVADAGRAADQVSLVAHPAADGYIRQTDGNPCARCLILAGKKFQWNQGFLRHPRCGCTHVPAGPDVVPQDPMSLYRAMTQAERIRAGFTRAEMRALDEGADIGQVVNARRGVFTAGGRRFTTEGTTRRGIFGQIARQQDGLRRGQRLRRPRLTPEQIYREAGADRAEAIRLLQRNGYLLPSPSAPSRATGARAATSTVEVRPVLAAARTPEDVSRVLAEEYRSVTGRTMAADLRGSVETAREHAEGVLRMVDQYPELRIASVRTGRTVKRTSYAEARHGDQEIVFSEDWSSVAKRDEYLAAVAEDARAGFHPAGFDPSAVAIHETAHLLDTATSALDREVDELLFRAQQQTGVPLDRAIRAGISEYAAKNHRELIAEAFADVMVNGDRASGLSRAIVRVVERQPGRGRGGLIIAGEALPSATDLSRLPVTRLQAMVREHGITVPTGLRKPALVKLVDDLDSGVPAATARERAVASIVDERRGIADALTRAGEAAEIGSTRALRAEAASLRRLLSTDQAKTAKPLLDALEAADEALVRAAIPAVARTAKLKQIGEAGAVARIPAGQVEWIGPGRSGVVSVVRPGWETTVERRVVLLQKAAAQAATPEQAARLATGRAAKTTAPAARMPEPIDRSTSPARVLEQEEAARTAALAAPPVKLKELPPRSAGGRVLRYYQHNGDEHMNGLLRRGRVGKPEGARTVPDAETVRASIEQVDEVLARSELTEPITVFRGMSRPPVSGSPGSTVGRTFSDKGYGSTSASRRRAFEFAPDEFDDGAAVMLEIRAPAGVRAVGISDEGFKGASPSVVSEQEILLERGLKYRIVSDEMRPDVVRFGGEVITATPYRHIVVEVIPPARAPAKAAKKATPRKAPAPPAPSRMSAPALRTELQRAGVDLDVTGVPKPVLAEHVTRLRTGSPAAAETARLRQAVIDRHRAAAETLAEALETIDQGADALAVRARARLRRVESTIQGWPQEAQIRSLLTAMATGNPATIRRAVATAERRLGLTRVDVSTMDRSLMSPVGGTIRDGARVEVVRPGYTVQVGGERVVLAKAVVREFDPRQAPTRPAPTIRAADLARAKRLIGDGRQLSLRAADTTPIEPSDLRNGRGTDADVAWAEDIRSRYPEEWARLVQDANMELSFTSWRRAHGLSDQPAAAVRARLAAEMAEQFRGAPIVIRRSSERSLLDILRGGRMKTQFETGQSGGLFDPDVRADWEDVAWGYARDIDPAGRVVYGYVARPGGDLASESQWLVGSYGEIRIELKPGVRQRTSVTVGDSLNGEQIPSPVDAPEWFSYNWKLEPGADLAAAQSEYRLLYVEAQIHGGVSVDDIAEITFVRRPSGAVVSELERLGIPWRVVGK